MLGLGLPEDIEAALAAWVETLPAAVPDLLAGVFGIVVSGVGGIVAFVVAWAGIPFFIFYALSDSPRLLSGLREAVPGSFRTSVFAILKILGDVFGAWARGTAIIAGIVFVPFVIGFTLFGIFIDPDIGEYALLFAATLAISELIPIIGPILALIPILAITAVIAGLPGVIAVGILFVIIEQIDGAVVQPKVQGHVLGPPSGDHPARARRRLGPRRHHGRDPGASAHRRGPPDDRVPAAHHRWRAGAPAGRGRSRRAPGRPGRALGRRLGTDRRGSRLMGWQILGPLATALVALIVAAWWFVFRIGRRVSPTADSGPIEVSDAMEYARRALAEPGPQHVDLARLWAPTSAADVEVLPEGRVFYPRMLEDIGRARHSVHVMQYGFQPGVIGDQFVPLFSAKARDGVAVRLVVDALGSHAYTGSKAMFNALAEAGVETMFHDLIPPDRQGPVGMRRMIARLRQTGRVEHRKLVLVDGATAYMGGAGLEDHFFDGRFHDVYIRFTGPITRQLQAIFLASFAYHGGRLPEGDGVLDGYFPPITEEGPHAVNVIMNWPRGWLPLTDAAVELIRTAERRLDIMNYYIGDVLVIREILEAARRGVRVRLVVADQLHANGVTYGAFLHHYDELLAAGVEIWEYPAVVHAKVIVSDDRALVGTLNLDAFALYRNPEMGLRFDDKVVADRFVSTLFEPDIAMSIPGRVASGRFRRARNRLFARGNYFY